MKAAPTAGVLVMACSFSACQSTRPSVVEPDAVVLVPSSASVVPVRAADPIAAASTPDLSGLFKLPAWEQFRSAWRKLDAAPSPSDLGSPKAMSEELHALELKCTDLLGAIESTDTAKALDPKLLPILRQIVSLRVAVLTGLGARLMMMHMMPSASQLAQAHAGSVLEQRIDALLELRRKGSVGPAEIETALQAISSQLLLGVALNAVSRSYGRSMGPMDSIEQLEQWANDAADAGSDPIVIGVRKGVEEARRLAPLLVLITANLES